jgi:single-stranded DNA-specific DHH superfamily exonuclease
MIPDEQILELRKAITESARPLIFFDDDPDGLCSFLQFYSLNNEARGIIFKRAGPLDSFFIQKVKEFEPDNIFILDVAEVSQEFLDQLHNVHWLDHHKPSKLKNVKYYNPMIKSRGKDNKPVSYFAYQVAAKKDPWLAMVGCVGDWHIPKDLVKEFRKEYPDLLPKEIKRPEDALFSTKVGEISKVFSFILKGDNAEAMACVKTLTRIKDPYEILDHSTSQGKFIWKNFMRHNKIYEEIKSRVKVSEDKILLFSYQDNRTSLTSELSNEILYRNPEKFIIICRVSNGNYKCSLRSSKYKVREILEKALVGLEGFGGGHMHACGCQVSEKDWEVFLENIRKQLD